MAGLEGIFGGFLGNASNTLGLLKYVLYGVVAGAGLFLLWYYMQFNVIVRIHERAGLAGYVIRMDKGRFKKDKNNPGVFLFNMMRDKRWQQPLDRDYVQIVKKAFGRITRIVDFAEDASGRLQPIRPVQSENLFAQSGWRNNDLEFTTAKIREYVDRFKKGDFWSKYGMLIQMGFMALLVVAMIVLFRELRGVTGGLTDVADALRQIAAQLNNQYSINASQAIVAG